MPRSSTTFTSQTAPKGNRKGQKASKTKVKEAIGLSGWERLTDFLLNEGADKMVESMKTLKPHQFMIAYNALSEFVKPKLSRQTLVGDEKNPVYIQTFKTYIGDADTSNPEADKGL